MCVRIYVCVCVCVCERERERERERPGVYVRDVTLITADLSKSAISVDVV
jgi:hypothetical protein